MRRLGGLLYMGELSARWAVFCTFALPSNIIHPNYCSSYEIYNLYVTWGRRALVALLLGSATPLVAQQYFPHGDPSTARRTWGALGLWWARLLLARQ